MKSLIQKYQEELNKFNLEFEVTRECNDKFNGKIKENGVVILEKWNVQKCLQYNKISSFAKMTKQSVDMHKQIQELIKK